MLSVVYPERRVFNSYEECHYADNWYGECHCAECGYAECHYAVCGYAECHYVEYGYAECRGAVVVLLLFVVAVHK